MKQKKITREEIPSMEEKDRMKYEIAEELGLLDQVLEEGWKSLSSKETGRIGGLMTRRRRKSAEDPALVEKGTVFLPQLLMSAEAAKTAFAVLKEGLENSGDVQEKKEKIVLATVKGDIHDIGKNIVKVLLENYSFEVVDLGKDVPPETIVDTVVAQQIRLVGLSALMTTTVVSMEETIRQLREKAPWCKVMVGGAVLNQEYADMIGADFYGKDAMQSVYYAQGLLQQ